MVVQKVRKTEQMMEQMRVQQKMVVQRKRLPSAQLRDDQMVHLRDDQMVHRMEVLKERVLGITFSSFPFHLSFLKFSFR